MNCYFRDTKISKCVGKSASKRLQKCFDALAKMRWNVGIMRWCVGKHKQHSDKGTTYSVIKKNKCHCDVAGEVGYQREYVWRCALCAFRRLVTFIIVTLWEMYLFSRILQERRWKGQERRRKGQEGHSRRKWVEKEGNQGNQGNQRTSLKEK